MVTVYTDWSALGNPWAWWWAFVLVRRGEKIYHNQWWEAHTTNNRMELLAAIHALEYIYQTFGQTDDIQTHIWSTLFDTQPIATKSVTEQIIVYSDSNYVQQWITSWIKTWIRRDWRVSKWSQRVKNADLWMRLHAIQWYFTDLHRKRVKAHAWNKWNEYVDRQAKSAAWKFL